MAITTVSGIAANLVESALFSKAVNQTSGNGRHFSTFYEAGIPNAAAAPTPGITGAALTSYAGQIPVPAASANTYLAGIRLSCSKQRGQFFLCDRLWHNSGLSVTSTASQTVNSVAWPARDNNGATNGEGILIGCEIRVMTSTNAPTLSMTYTNSAGTGSRTSTNVITTVAASNPGLFYVMSLQAGDLGVQSIQNFQLSASWTTGAMHLVAFRILATVEVTDEGLIKQADALTSNFVRLYDNTVPFVLWMAESTTASFANAVIDYAQG